MAMRMHASCQAGMRCCGLALTVTVSTLTSLLRPMHTLLLGGDGDVATERGRAEAAEWHCALLLLQTGAWCRSGNAQVHRSFEVNRRNLRWFRSSQEGETRSRNDAETREKRGGKQMLQGSKL
jgi:hypothetical protein